jgi:hypothetical protein
MSARALLGWLVALGPVALTACPALLSNDFRIAADGGGSAQSEGADATSGLADTGTTVGSSGTGSSGSSGGGEGEDAGRSDASADARSGLPIDSSVSGSDSAPPVLCCDDVPCTSGSAWVGAGNVACDQLTDASVGEQCYVASVQANSVVTVCQ